MAGTAVVAPRRAEALRDSLQVDRLPDLARLGRKLGVLVRRVPGPCRQLLVGAGAIVAHQAVDVFRLGEIEGSVLPAEPGVATGAARLVAGQRDAVVVHRVRLAEVELLAGGLLARLPGPVHRAHEVLGLLLVARQTGAGDLRTVLERSLDQLRMIDGCVRMPERERADRESDGDEAAFHGVRPLGHGRNAAVVLCRGARQPS